MKKQTDIFPHEIPKVFSEKNPEEKKILPPRHPAPGDRPTPTAESTTRGALSVTDRRGVTPCVPLRIRKEAGLKFGELP